MATFHIRELLKFATLYCNDKKIAKAPPQYATDIVFHDMALNHSVSPALLCYLRYLLCAFVYFYQGH